MHPLEWSISRDPEVFPDPDAWNPTRWLDSKYPTFQEPLSKFPTITSYSQFGYGRRTCQGMGVTEADLFVGIGSMAWMFSMHADTEDVEAEEEAAKVEKVSRAEQKVLRAARAATGLQTPPDEEVIREQLVMNSVDGARGKLMAHANDSAISVPGGFPEKLIPTGRPNKLAGKPELPKVQSMFAPAPSSPTQSGASPTTKATGKSKKSHNPSAESDPSATDPTMDFSTLLIAKPKPFKFNLRTRSQEKANRVARQWMELKMDGEFEDSRVYWQGGNTGNEEHGWGEVFT